MTGTAGRGRSGCALLLALSLRVAAQAGVPTLEHLYPAGALPGSSNLVAASGKFDPWPPQVWISGSGVTFQPTTNQGKFEVTLEPEATPGPRLVRVFNAEGASDPRLFVVGNGVELAETEPNNHFAKPQMVVLGDGVDDVTLNGRLDTRGDVDAFAVAVGTGQWLEARLEAYQLMSKLDGVLRLVTTNGLVLAWNHDDTTLDPRLTWRATQEGSVVLQVFGFPYPAESSVALAGGDGAVYRLHLAVKAEPPADRFEGAPEREPNDGPALAGEVPTPLPLEVTGAIDREGDVDRFPFAAVGGSHLDADLAAAFLGSPLDAWLRIETLDGKELAANDDREGGRDPRLEWRVPADGAYVVAVGSTLRHRGDAASRYRLGVRQMEPDFRGQTAASGWVLAAGGTNEIKVSVVRRFGQTNELRVEMRGLPPGVAATSPVVAAGGGEVTLQLLAAAEADAFGAPVSLVLLEPATGRERPVGFDLVSRGENNGVPQGWARLLVEGTTELWLTVKR